MSKAMSTYIKALRGAHFFDQMGNSKFPTQFINILKANSAQGKTGTSGSGYASNALKQIRFELDNYYTPVNWFSHYFLWIGQGEQKNQGWQWNGYTQGSGDTTWGKSGYFKNINGFTIFYSFLPGGNWGMNVPVFKPTLPTSISSCIGSTDPKSVYTCAIGKASHWFYTLAYNGGNDGFFYTYTQGHTGSLCTSKTCSNAGAIAFKGRGDGCKGCNSRRLLESVVVESAAEDEAQEQHAHSRQLLGWRRRRRRRVNSVLVMG
jgi:hypothetical protein